jgi:hypothetical protein
MALSDIVNKIKEHKSFAEEVVNESDDPRTVKSRIGRKNQSREMLKVLYREYKAELRNKIAVLLVTGSEAKAFCDVAEAEGNMISATADALYEDIVNRIDERLLSGTESTSSLIDIMSRYLEDKAGDLDVESYPSLRAHEKYSERIRNKNDMLNLTKRMINTEIGVEMVGFEVLEQVTQKAVNDMFDGKILPVVVLLKDDSLVESIAEGLRTIGNVTVVVAGEGHKAEGALSVKEIDNEKVFSVLKKMQKDITKTKGAKNANR